jgi:hypothetical protein
VCVRVCVCARARTPLNVCYLETSKGGGLGPGWAVMSHKMEIFICKSPLNIARLFSAILQGNVDETNIPNSLHVIAGLLSSSGI